MILSPYYRLVPVFPLLTCEGKHKNLGTVVADLDIDFFHYIKNCTNAGFQMDQMIGKPVAITKITISVLNGLVTFLLLLEMTKDHRF